MPVHKKMPNWSLSCIVIGSKFLLSVWRFIFCHFDLTKELDPHIHLRVIKGLIDISIIYHKVPLLSEYWYSYNRVTRGGGGDRGSGPP